MPIPAQLEKLTVKQLTALAKKAEVSNWHGMRKDDLISALKKQAKKARKFAKTAKVVSKGKLAAKTTAKSTKTAKTSKKTIKSKTGTSQSTKKSVKTKPATKLQQKSPVKAATKTPAKTTVKPTVKLKTAVKEKTIVPEKKIAKPVPAPAKTPAVANKAIVHIAVPQVPPPKSPVFRGLQPVVEKSDAEQRADSEFRLANLKKSLLKYRELSGVFDGEHDDRLLLMACDSHWLRAFWELSAKLVERARAAMGAYWHTAEPILRLYQIVADGISKQRRVHVRDIKLQGNVNNWYIDVNDPPSSFLIEIGYVSSKGRFFPLASSNVVETPENHGTGQIEQSDDVNWFDKAKENARPFRHGGEIRNGNFELDRQLRRSVPVPLIARFGGEQIETVKVDLEADVVIYGITQPDVQLTIKNEPIRLQPDGRFSVRFHLPEKRQVYPIVAVSSDGIESQTTILAIERNTKALETVYREHDELD